MKHPLAFPERLAPTSGPKRILALDGGGLRGVLTLGMLRTLETQLRQRHGGDPNFRLCDYFDLIAGTSTGAIIASALALGMSVEEVFGHYQRLGESVFKQSLLRAGPLKAFVTKFSAADVERALRGVFEERQLNSADFRTGLLVVAKRLDTGSIWPLTNNPNSPYFERGQQSTTIANGEYPLWQVVRASTAAPTFFDPETIEIGRADAQVKAVKGEFIDGGASPHNNPALQALMVATMPGYGFGWQPGAEQLLVVSLGTGKSNAEIGLASLLESNPLVHAKRSLLSLMEDCADLVETTMQWLSNSPTARKIDRVMGTTGGPLGGTAMCSYLRYNVHLEAAWYSQNMGEEASAQRLKDLEAMDKTENFEELHRMGCVAGERQIRPEHFNKVFDVN